MEKHKVKQDSKAFQLVRYSTAEWNFMSVILIGPLVVDFVVSLIIR